MTATPPPVWRQRLGTVTLAAFALIVAIVSFRSALATGIQHGDPALAVRIAPGDARAQTLLADAIQRADRPQDRAQLAYLARRALRDSALNAEAMRILAFAEGGTSVADTRLLARRIAVSRRLSRRDVAAAFWTIEDRVAAGDAAQVLRTYDSLLRVSPPAGELLVPVLVSAMSEAEIRARLVPYVRADAPWMVSLATQAASGAPADLARVVIAAGGLPKRAAYDRLRPSLIGALVAAGEAPLARLVVDRTVAQGSKMLAQPGLTALSTDPATAPLSWESRDGGDFAAGFEAQRGAVALSISVSAQAPRTVARRVLFLEPGRYGLSARIATDAGSGTTGWRIGCVAGRSKAMLVEGDIKLQFEVPTGCAAQLVELRATSESGQFGHEFRVSDILLLRLS